MKERRLHSKQVDLALSKLSGIETALQGRVALVCPCFPIVK